MKKLLYFIGFLVFGQVSAQSIGYDSTYNNIWLKESGRTFSGGMSSGIGTMGYSTAIGYESGRSNTTGALNTYLGALTGNEVTTGYGNTLVGAGAGAYFLTTGSENVFVGINTGGVSTGNANVLIGRNVGTQMDTYSNTVGIGNQVKIGNQAIGIGYSAYVQGENSIGIGVKAFSTGLNSVAIGTNASVSQPNTIVLGGITGINEATVNSKVGIGTNIPRSELEVKGKVIVGDSITSLPGGYNMYVSQGILTEALTLGVKNTSQWADYVFEKEYKLRPLSDLKAYIEQHKHLPEIPSTAEVVREGINIGEMQSIFLKKIEELTLYIIQLEERLKTVENK